MEVIRAEIGTITEFAIEIAASVMIQACMDWMSKDELKGDTVYGVCWMVRKAKRRIFLKFLRRLRVSKTWRIQRGGLFHKKQSSIKRGKQAGKWFFHKSDKHTGPEKEWKKIGPRKLR